MFKWIIAVGTLRWMVLLIGWRELWSNGEWVHRHSVRNCKMESRPLHHGPLGPFLPRLPQTATSNWWVILYVTRQQRLAGEWNDLGSLPRRYLDIDESDGRTNLFELLCGSSVDAMIVPPYLSLSCGINKPLHRSLTDEWEENFPQRVEHLPNF